MDSKTTKNKSGRPKKEDKYVKERKEILDEILDVIGITPDNDTFYVEDNYDKEQDILDIMEKAKQYFKMTNWPCTKPGRTKLVYLSFIKSLLKEMDIKFIYITANDSNRKIIKKGYIISAFT